MFKLRSASLHASFYPVGRFSVTSVVLIGTDAVTHWVDAGVPRVLALPFQQIGALSLGKRLLWLRRSDREDKRQQQDGQKYHPRPDPMPQSGHAVRQSHQPHPSRRVLPRLANPSNGMACKSRGQGLARRSAGASRRFRVSVSDRLRS